MRVVLFGLVGAVLLGGAAEAKICRLDGLKLSAAPRSEDTQASLNGATFKVVRQASSFKTGFDPSKGRVATSGSIAIEIEGDKGRFLVQQDYIPSSSPWVSAVSLEPNGKLPRDLAWGKRDRATERKLFESDGSFDIYSGPLGGYTLSPVNCKE